jgi:hypothetical protein
MTDASVQKMKVGATRFARADCATVYEIAADSSGYPDWSAIGSFEEVRQGTDSRYGVGSERIYRTGIFTIREDVVAADKDRYIAYRLLSGFPLKDYLGEITIAPEGERTRIDWYSSFIPPRGFGWFWRWFMQQVLTGTTEGLVKEAEKRAAARQA